jgi:hypothetical protein
MWKAGTGRLSMYGRLLDFRPPPLVLSHAQQRRSDPVGVHWDSDVLRVQSVLFGVTTLAQVQLVAGGPP